jgi:hypothetical protein
MMALPPLVGGSWFSASSLPILLQGSAATGGQQSLLHPAEEHEDLRCIA